MFSVQGKEETKTRSLGTTPQITSLEICGNGFCGTSIKKKRRPIVKLPTSLQWACHTCRGGSYCSSDEKPMKEQRGARQMLLDTCWCPIAVGMNQPPNCHLSVAVKQCNMD